MTTKKRVAIVGAGIAGLGCAYALRQSALLELTVFEGGDHLGGHSHTIDIEINTPTGLVRHGVDTGFLVFNRQTYPRLLRLFEELAVPIVASEMSFSVALETPTKVSPAGNPERALEWAGTNLNAFFGQRKNIFKPAFWLMAYDIMRFNRLATALALKQKHEPHTNLGREESIAVFLKRHRFSEHFCQWYFLPMIGAIWSCPVEQMLAFPILSMARFCHNHGLLKIQGRPQWLTVQGGSREYVKRLVSALELHAVTITREKVLRVTVPENTNSGSKIAIQTAQGIAYFDEVVMACHSDESLRLVHGNSAAEKAVLASIPYQQNRAILHTDSSFLPTAKRCWASWNYVTEMGHTAHQATAVSVNYLINKLQPLPVQLEQIPIIVSLNPLREPKPETIHAVVHYAHPIFDASAIQAQYDLALMQGKSSVWYCGAWAGYGFHEDGLRSGELVAADLLEHLHSFALPAPVQRTA
ncbi:NAD(P)-binding protein [Polynucleobacter sp. IMCC30063]|uniref:NAD(P)/FAD-dependent oxidoreductase n=1 Tax=unclassified Polynucleobacter TaxID=2640945 RepID=UPI001F4271DF|nr:MULTISPECIES: FAD-dependent oxidoreductase [unclassified Polynucleobacter]MCE7504752.1 NAD(P)-binding protein [Polynucleobacter sp. IMCC30063]MCE7529730.1 NAD(P)-binding protein [Polynucleobacter sp. IMCC 29146]